MSVATILRLNRPVTFVPPVTVQVKLAAPLGQNSFRLAGKLVAVKVLILSLSISKILKDRLTEVFLFT